MIRQLIIKFRYFQPILPNTRMSSNTLHTYHSATIHPASMGTSNLHSTPPDPVHRHNNINNKQYNITQATDESVHFDVAQLSSTEVYKLLIGSIIPRPIAWISTINSHNQTNLAPYSFMNGVAHSPPTIMFSSVRNNDGTYKDSIRNIIETNQFVINMVSESNVEQMNLTSATLEYGISELEQYGLTPIKCDHINGYRIAESMIAFECQLQQITHIGEPNQGSDCVFGTVVAIHVRKSCYLGNYKIDVGQYKPIARLAGNGYARVKEIFELIRPS